MKEFRPEIHYAWLIMAACSLVIFYSIGLAVNMFSIFLTPVINSLSLTKTQGASIMSAVSAASVAAIAISGWAYSKFSIRWLNLFCAVLMAAGFALLSLAPSLKICYLAALCVGFGQGAGSIIPVAALMTNWFAANRGLALGIAATSSGIANIIFAPLLNWIINTYSLTAAFLFQSASILALAAAAALMIRDHPACMGCRAYGAEKAGSASSSGALKDRVTESAEGIFKGENKLKDILRSKDYWTLCGVVFMIGVILVPTNNHLPAFLISNGYSSTFAASVFSLFGLSMVAGKVAYGRIIDKWGNYRANTYIYAMLAAALLSTFLVGKSESAPYLFGILLGLGNPIGTISLPIWTSDLFGTANYVQTYTSIKVFLTLGTSVGYTVVGFMVDRTGAYTSSFGLFAVLMAIGYAALQLTYSRHAKCRIGVRHLD